MAISHSAFSSINIFEELAKSREVFKSVGEISFSKTQGSGVYIGNQMVITAAHCIPDHFPNDTYLESLDDFGYFATTEINGERQSARILMITRHPQYTSYTRYTRKVAGNPDIAVLLIDIELNNILPAKVDYTWQPILEDLISVGFTRYMAPCSPDKKPIPQPPLKESQQVAIKIPQLVYSSLCKNMKNRTGFKKSADIDILQMMALLLLLTQSPLQRFGLVVLWMLLGVFRTKHLVYDPLEGGVHAGMSGGACFSSDSKLVAINVASSVAEGFSSVAGNIQYFTPLALYQSWIDQVSQAYKTQLPALMKMNLQWLKLFEEELGEEYEEDDDFATVSSSIPTHKIYSVFPKNLSFLFKHRSEAFQAQRHDNPQLQHEYDKHFGLIIRPLTHGS